MLNEKVVEEALRAIAVLNEEVGIIQITVASLNEAVNWLKMIMGYQMLGIVLILVGLSTNILLTHRNGKKH